MVSISQRNAMMSNGDRGDVLGNNDGGGVNSVNGLMGDGGRNMSYGWYGVHNRGGVNHGGGMNDGGGTDNSHRLDDVVARLMGHGGRGDVGNMGDWGDVGNVGDWGSHGDGGVSQESRSWGGGGYGQNGGQYYQLEHFGWLVGWLIDWVRRTLQDCCLSDGSEGVLYYVLVLM